MVKRFNPQFLKKYIKYSIILKTLNTLVTYD